MTILTLLIVAVAYYSFISRSLRVVIIVLSLTAYVAFNGTAHALEVGTFSHSHHLVPGEYNENNPGVWVENNGIGVGWYVNSHNESTAFVSGVWRKDITRIGRARVSLKLGYGLIYGYKLYGTNIGPANGHPDLLPFASPSIAVSFGQWSLNTHVVGQAIGWSTSWRF